MKSEDGAKSLWYERYEKSKKGTKSPWYESSMVRKVHKWYETSMVRKVWHSFAVSPLQMWHAQVSGTRNVRKFLVPYKFLVPETWVCVTLIKFV